MHNTSLKEGTAFTRISAIVENLIANSSWYQERLNKEEITNHIYNLFNKHDIVANIDTISQEDLIERIDSILVTHAVAGSLNDLTPEEMAIFDEAVRRK
ncbi:MAG TPA: hypothetical protein VK203_09885 [Nostocaceae cyanobacterium]|nr:hypothetical protein [Nostocaceae cyanobacterium]